MSDTVPNDKVAQVLNKMNDASNSKERYDILYEFSQNSYKAGAEMAIDAFAQEISNKLNELFNEETAPGGG